MPQTLQEKREASRVRMERSRARAKLETKVTVIKPIGIPDTVAMDLVALGFLDENDVEDPQKLTAATSAMVREWGAGRLGHFTVAPQQTADKRRD